MANPQLENGFTMIANEILDSLMLIDLSANQWQVLLCIIRKTYGFKRKVGNIANFQICQATGLRKDVVSRALHNLELIGVIFRNGKTIGFQKNYHLWKLAELQTRKLAELQTKVGSPTPTGEAVNKKEINILNKASDISKNKNNHSSKTWQQALEILKAKVSASNYRAYYERTAAISHQGGDFIISAPNSTIADYLNNRQRSLTEAVLIELIKAPVNLRCVVSAPGGVKNGVN